MSTESWHSLIYGIVTAVECSDSTVSAHYIAPCGVEGTYIQQVPAQQLSCKKQDGTHRRSVPSQRWARATMTEL